MVAPWIVPAITGGAGILGSLFRGSGPEWTPDEANRRAQQQQLARYQAMQLGQGPSLAGQQLQQGLRQSQRQQQAAASGARGGALQQSLARRQAANIGGQMSAQANQAASTARTMEQLSAMGRVDRGLAQQEQQKLRDYQIARGEFDRGGQQFGNIFGAIGDVGNIPGLFGGGGDANSWKLKK